MTLPCIIVMVIGVALALCGMNKQKAGAVWGQPLSIIGAIIAIVGALWNSVNTLAGGDADAIAAQEKRYTILEHQKLGEYLKSLNPSKVAVLTNPLNYYDEYGEERPTPRESNALTGLKKGLGGVEIIELYCPIPKTQKKEGSEIEPPMMDFMVTGKQLKELAAKAKDADIVIKLNELPMENSMLLLQILPKTQKLAMVDFDDMNKLEKFFDGAGKACADLVAVVTTKYSYDYESKIPSSDEKAFAHRYSLITKENYKTEIANATKR